jgi:hypothetical protein
VTNLAKIVKGKATTAVARSLSQVFGPQGLDVLYAHGQKETEPEKQLGNIVCWFGTIYENQAMLAFLDIAVVSRETGKVLVLIEIEENRASPKALMADAFTTLIGDHITFQGNQELKVGRWTRLVFWQRLRKWQRTSVTSNCYRKD